MRHTALGSLRTDRGNRSPHISPAASSTASVEHPTRHLSSTRPSSPSLPCKLGLRSPCFWPCPGKGQRAFQPTPLFSTPESRPSTRFIGLCVAVDRAIIVAPSFFVPPGCHLCCGALRLSQAGHFAAVALCCCLSPFVHHCQILRPRIPRWHSVTRRYIACRYNTPIQRVRLSARGSRER